MPALLIVIGLIALLVIFGIVLYNGLVRKRNTVDNAWSQIDVQLKRRIDEATRYASLDQLCLSPQCGFSSTHHGNNLSTDEQKRKLAHVVELADEIWGTA